jgi:hypothetical protein
MLAAGLQTAWGVRLTEDEYMHLVRLNTKAIQLILLDKTKRSDTTNIQSSFFNLQSRFARVGCQV